MPKTTSSYIESPVSITYTTKQLTILLCDEASTENDSAFEKVQDKTARNDEHKIDSEQLAALPSLSDQRCLNRVR